jgi:acyl transferase domain-containing protein
VNSFGYGGSNAHVVLQDAQSFLKDYQIQPHTSSFAARNFDNFLDDDDDVGDAALARPNILVFSANDEPSLKSYYDALKRHLINPVVNIKLSDLAYTLSEHRSRHFYRGYLVTTKPDLPEGALVIGKKSSEVPKVGFVFTGQGAQWSQMGKGIIDHYDGARPLLQRLDAALQKLPTPPSWSIIGRS